MYPPRNLEPATSRRSRRRPKSSLRIVAPNFMSTPHAEPSLDSSDSAAAPPTRTSADPVSKKRPRVRSSATLCLMASSSSGTRWTSSTVTGPLIEETKATGSFFAADNVARSSKGRYCFNYGPACRASTKVVFPDCLGPRRNTTGAYASASLRVGWIWR